MQFIPYLSFQGECAAAFDCYAGLFGGKVSLIRFAEAPANPAMPALPENQRDWVMHARLDLPDGSALMGADMPPQFGGTAQAGVSISVWRKDAAEARALFDALSTGGKVSMPFGETFFATGFGMCRDRFGTSWMVGTRPA